MKIPSQYLPVMPYIIIENSRGFADFVKKVFGATEQLIVPDDKGRVMHGELKIHDAVIMFATATDNYSSKTAGMYIYIEDVDKVYAAALDNGAQSIIPPETKDYGYTAGFEDPFGNQWWVVQGE